MVLCIAARKAPSIFPRLYCSLPFFVNFSINLYSILYRLYMLFGTRSPNSIQHSHSVFTWPQVWSSSSYGSKASIFQLFQAFAIVCVIQCCACLRLYMGNAFYFGWLLLAPAIRFSFLSIHRWCTHRFAARPTDQASLPPQPPTPDTARHICGGQQEELLCGCAR